MAKNLLFFYGDDEFSIARRLTELQTQLDASGLNTARLEARLVSLDELNNAVNTMPFLSDRRLVFLANPSARTSNPDEREKFLEFLLTAPPTTVIVLHELVEPREASKHWLVRRAAKGDLKAEAFFLPTLKEMPAWIVQEAKRQGGQMELAAAVRLTEMVGDDTRVAAQEIAKLLTYVNFARPVTLVDVETVSIVSAQGDVFALVDAIGSRQVRLAQRMLHQLLQSEDSFALWGMIIRQFRLLLQAREILDGGGGAREVQQRLGVHEFVATKITEQAQRFSLSALETLYHRLLEIDEQVKTGQVALDLALDILIVELARR
ncbi:MAG: DNA polymerase III subunit delta [Anaerolineales bacterium]|nr:DNA polymerase III subunit delta [Anaerolineales bacterium]